MRAMRTTNTILQDASKTVVELRKEARELQRRAVENARNADELENDIRTLNWRNLAKYGFLTWDEESALVQNRRHSRRRR
jgi:hypothetical protein